MEKIPRSLIAVIVGILMVNFEMIRMDLLDAFTITLLAGIEFLLSCVMADGMINGRQNSGLSPQESMSMKSWVPCFLVQRAVWDRLWSRMPPSA